MKGIGRKLPCRYSVLALRDFCTLRRVSSTSSRRLHKVKILDVKEETPTISRVNVQVLDDNFTFLPGQWIDFIARVDGCDCVGGYSPCSSPSTLPSMQLAIRYNPNHPISSWIHEKRETNFNETTVRIRGGSGSCVYSPNDDDNVTFVAGGIGITPLLSMIRSALETEIDFHIRLFYSARSQKELAFMEELRALAKNESRFEVYFTTTREDVGATSPTYIGCGRWTAEHIISSQSIKTKYYLFGPPAMVDSLTTQMLSSGIPSINICTEKWW